MFDRLKNLYEAGRITKEGLRNAVRNDWITQSDYKTITGDNF